MKGGRKIGNGGRAEKNGRREAEAEKRAGKTS